MKDLGVKARIEAAIDISLGLRVTLLGIAAVVFANNIKEAVMVNANVVVMACVWCGVVFLRLP